MSTSHGRGSTALLADGAIHTELDALISDECDVVWYDDARDLLHEDVLPGVAVFVVRTGPMPRGIPLAVLARLNLEYPQIQKIAVVEGPLPLPLARFLTSCRVELVWANPDGNVEHIASVVDRMLSQSGWIAPWAARSARRIRSGGSK